MDSIIDDIIKRKIINVITGTNVELEARFTDYQSEQGVTVRNFDRVLTHFKNEKYEYKETYTEDQNYNSMRLSIDKQGNKTLMKKRRIEDFPILIKEYSIKIGASIEEILINDEKDIQDFKNKISQEKDTSIRIKNRTSFTLVSGKYSGVRLDMTRVDMIYFNSTQGNRVTNTKYEIELELLPEGNLESWYYFMLNVLKVIQDTEIVYTKEEYGDIMKFSNDILGATETNRNNIDGRNLMDARNLKYRDLISGGIVNSIINGKKVSYRVSIKSDGVRKLMVIQEQGIWLLWDTEANKIYPGNQFTKRYHGYIFDGELIPNDPEHRKGSPNEIVKNKYWYLIFDTLSRRALVNDKTLPDPSVRRISHQDRMQIAQFLVDDLTKDNDEKDLTVLLQLNTKAFFNLEDSSAFFRGLRQVENFRKISLYKDDGLIFVPNEAPYVRTTARLGERVLTRYPDICKFKEDLTIDFAVSYVASREGRKMIIQGYDNSKRTYLFQWMKKDKLGYLNIHPSLYGLFKDVQMVEYEYNESGIQKTKFVFPNKFDLRKVHSNSTVHFFWTGKGYIGSITYNKPDKLDIIVSRIKTSKDFNMKVEWKNIGVNLKVMESFFVDYQNPYTTINRPIDDTNEMLKDLPSGVVVEFTWKDDKFVPIRKRYNKKYPNNLGTIEDNLNLIEDPIDLETLLGLDIRLMRKYHNTIKTKLFQDAPGDYLLDLGSGRGGDVFKWIKYKKIIAVEPNADHIIELVRRAMDIFELAQIKVITNISELSHDLSNDRIIILRSGAENSELITKAVDVMFNGKADVVSMMLSLSFFWLPDQSGATALPGLMRTVGNNLKIGGNFIYLTIDGDKVKNMFDPPIKGPIVDYVELLNGNIKMKYEKSEQKLKVLFKGTIVGSEEEEQIESLVLLNDLRNRFKSIGILEQYVKDANGQLFLNASELELTKLYTYGSFYRKSSVVEGTGGTEGTGGNQVPDFLIGGTLEQPLQNQVTTDGTITNETQKEVKCKWYSNKVYRYGLVNYEGDEISNLLSAILRVYQAKEYPKNAFSRYDIIDEYRKKLPELDSIESFKDKIVYLGKTFQIDICVVDITTTNLIPIVSKFGNYNYAIVLGRIGESYENILTEVDGKFNFSFSDRNNPDPFLLNLTIMGLLSSSPEEKIKQNLDSINKMINGNMQYSETLALFSQIIKNLRS